MFSFIYVIYDSVQVNIMSIHKSDTFKSASDVQKPIIIELPNITGIQPSIVIKSFAGLTFIVEVTHEDMTTINTHLHTN